MNTIARFHQLAVTLTIAALLLFCSKTAGTENAHPVAGLAAPANTTTLPVVQHVSIDRAPLPDLVRDICKSFGVDCVLSPELSKIVVERLDLHSADLETILTAVKVASGNKFQFRFDTKDGKTIVFVETISDAAAPDSLARIDLDIIDGEFELEQGRMAPATVKNLTEFIHKKMPDMNIVLSPGAGDVRVENLRMRSVTLEDFLQALTVATDRSVQLNRLPGDGRSFSLMARPRSSASERTVEVFNLSEYFMKTVGPRAIFNLPEEYDKCLNEKMNEMLKIIDETVTMATRSAAEDEADSRYDVRFHSGAKLLVVLGTPKTLDTVRKVVTALNQPTIGAQSLPPIVPQPR